MTSIVLAGGKGLRLGCDKALELIGNRSLLQRVVDRLALLGGEIIIAAAQEQELPSPRGATKIVVDLYPDKGALGGIYTGLAASNSHHSLVVACDMPLLNLPLLRYLLQLAPDFDAVVLKIGENIEPLHAVYSKNCLIPIQHQIEQGELRVGNLFSQVRVRFVEEEEINRFDPEHLSFFNINTAADLERATTFLSDPSYAF